MTNGGHLPGINPAHFPGLNPQNSEKTSEIDRKLNCVGWALGQATGWWWPDVDVRGIQLLLPRSSWPDDLPRIVTVDNIMHLFERRGYELCHDHALEAGFLKIAIYALPNNHPTHVARQLSSGRWTSKLGEGIDLSHSSPADLQGPKYGRVARFMRRSLAVSRG
jgi:hypothetical protein